MSEETVQPVNSQSKEMQPDNPHYWKEPASAESTLASERIFWTKMHSTFRNRLKLALLGNNNSTPILELLARYKDTDHISESGLVKFIPDANLPKRV